MGLTAENLAKDYSISRLEQEEFALHSHNKALSAQSNGLLTDEIVGIRGDENVIEKDGCMRETSIEKMAKLPPAFLDEMVL